MKNILSVLTGAVVLLLASGYAYADERMPGAMDTSDKMITNEDLPTVTPDQGGATFNQMPAEPGAEGSAAGGMNGDPDSWNKESDQGKGPADERELGPGGEKPDTGGYEYDRDMYRHNY